MKILLTGGCGFLGHHVTEHLLKNTDAEIVILDKLTYASAGFDRLRDIGCFDDRRVRVIGCDLGAPVEPGVRRELGKVDFIVHAAAETHVDRSIEDPLPFLKSNVVGTHNLLMLARELGPQRTFLVSTDEVYGPAPFGFPGYAEDARINPTNPYAATKAAAEALGMAYANTYKLPITIVNGMNFFGERQHPEKFVPMCIKKIQAGEKVVIHADPALRFSGTRFYLHCRNFADALLHLTRVGSMAPKVHVVGDKEISNLAMAEMIAGFLGKRLNYELVNFHGSRPGHDLRYALVSNSLLGWKRPYSLEGSLERVVRWYLDPKNERWLNW